jgi:hypothetical protein
MTERTFAIVQAERLAIDFADHDSIAVLDAGTIHTCPHALAQQTLPVYAEYTYAKSSPDSERTFSRMTSVVGVGTAKSGRTPIVATG